MDKNIQFLIGIFNKFSKPGYNWFNYYGKDCIISIPNTTDRSINFVKINFVKEKIQRNDLSR